MLFTKAMYNNEVTTTDSRIDNSPSSIMRYCTEHSIFNQICAKTVFVL